MTWLFPLYLFGAAAVIGPILMHLRRRPPQDRVEFSSLMFLEAQTPMPVSKRRLENWLLLLLRCLALLLLAFMFARPLWRTDQALPTSLQTATVLLLDRSASMQRGTLWQQAREAALQRLAEMAAGDRVAVAMLDHQTQLLWSFDQDQKQSASRLATLKPALQQTKPGWGATHLGQGLVDAVGWFASSPGMSGWKKRVVLISDFQEGSRLEALRSLVWPENIVVEVVQVAEPVADNFTLSLAAVVDASGAEPDAGPVDALDSNAVQRVRLSNSRESKSGDYQLAWDQVGAVPISGYLPPGSSRVIRMEKSVPSPERSADQPSSLRVSGDAWPFDNQVFMAPSPPKPVKIVFIGDETTRDEPSSPLFYLSRALQPTASLRPELSTIAETATGISPATEVVFLSGAKPSDALCQALKSWMASGGTMVAVLSEGMSSMALENLTGTADWQVSTSTAAVSAEQYQMLAEVQTSHPLLRPFADERLRDFTKLRFWRHRRLAWKADLPAGVEVLARFDQGDPAIVSCGVGKGRLILLTSGWHPADSQLALSTKFVPLLYGWLEAAGFRHELPPSLTVGDELPLNGATAIQTPEGQTLRPKAGESVLADVVGLYTFIQGDGSKESRAVNLAPEEGRVTPLELSKLRDLGVRLEEAAASPDARSAGDQERLALADQEAQQKAWLWLLSGLIAALLLETWLAGRSRHGTPQPAYSSP